MKYYYMNFMETSPKTRRNHLAKGQPQALWLQNKFELVIFHFPNSDEMYLLHLIEKSRIDSRQPQVFLLFPNR